MGPSRDRAEDSESLGCDLDAARSKAISWLSGHATS
jgi:hypothetical protein